MSGVNDGRLIDYDPTTGIAEKYYEIDGQWYLTHEQAEATVKEIVERNKFEYNSTDERARFKKRKSS